MSIIEQFRGEVERFLDAHKMDPTTFGKQSVNDPNFVFRLRNGTDPRISTVERVRSFMASKRRRGVFRDR